jgi:hypothetical protein
VKRRLRRHRHNHAIEKLGTFVGIEDTLVGQCEIADDVIARQLGSWGRHGPIMTSGNELGKRRR